MKDAKGDNAGEDFGKHVKVKFLWNWDKQSEPVYETTLADLQKLIRSFSSRHFAPEWGKGWIRSWYRGLFMGTI